MDVPRSEPAGTRFDELHAEAKEALAYRREHPARRPRPLSRGLPGRPVPLAGARGRPRRPRARTMSAADDPAGRAGRPRRPRPAPPTSGCGRCAARWPGPAATWAATRRSCRAWSSRSATSRVHLAVPGARRRDADHGARAAGRCPPSCRCGSWRPRRPSGPGSPRRSTTARRRRCPTPSSRWSSSTASSSPIRAWPARSCASCASCCAASWATSGASCPSCGRPSSTSWASTAPSSTRSPRRPPCRASSIATELDGATNGLTEATQTVVLRVVQEALQNVRKHASRHERGGRDDAR